MKTEYTKDNRVTRDDRDRIHKRQPEVLRYFFIGSYLLGALWFNSTYAIPLTRGLGTFSSLFTRYMPSVSMLH